MLSSMGVPGYHCSSTSAYRQPHYNEYIDIITRTIDRRKKGSDNAEFSVTRFLLSESSLGNGSHNRPEFPVITAPLLRCGSLSYENASWYDKLRTAGRAETARVLV